MHIKKYIPSAVLTLSCITYLTLSTLSTTPLSNLANAATDLSSQVITAPHQWNAANNYDTATTAAALLAEQTILIPYFSRKYNADPSTVSHIVQTAQLQGYSLGIDYKLILAMIEQESSFRPDIGNWYGAVGLMQVVPRFHHSTIAALSGELNYKKHTSVLKNPEKNVEIGTEILNQFAERRNHLLKPSLQKYSGNAYLYSEKVNALRQQINQQLLTSTQPS